MSFARAIFCILFCVFMENRAFFFFDPESLYSILKVGLNAREQMSSHPDSFVQFVFFIFLFVGVNNYH